MATQESGPRELLVGRPFPRPEAMEARRAANSSDIFPAHNLDDIDGVLGDCHVMYPQFGNPLHHLAEELRLLRTEAYEKEQDNNWVRTEEIRRVLQTTLLQIELIQCINGAYMNLLENGYTPVEAAQIIDGYIDSKDASVVNSYDNILDKATSNLAALERRDSLEEVTEFGGIPVIDISLFGTLQPLSPDERFKLTQAAISDNIRATRLRMQRLEFEWLSAKVIVNVLEENIDASNPAL